LSEGFVQREATVSDESKKEFDKRDAVWKILQRYDAYITTANSKVGLLMAFESLLVPAIAFKIDDIFKMFSYKPLAYTAVFVISLPLLISLMVFREALGVIKPDTSSPQVQGKSVYKSLIFFGHVADKVKFRDHDSYLDEWKTQTPELDFTDCALQAHAVAKILNDKLVGIERATDYLCKFQLPPLVLIALLKIADILIVGAGLIESVPPK